MKKCLINYVYCKTLFFNRDFDGLRTNLRIMRNTNIIFFYPLFCVGIDARPDRLDTMFRAISTESCLCNGVL